MVVGVVVVGVFYKYCIKDVVMEYEIDGDRVVCRVGRVVCVEGFDVFGVIGCGYVLMS